MRCAACEKGQLHLQSYSASAEYKGVKRELRQHMLRCDHCKAELFDDACGRFNRRAYVAFQKSVDGIPTGAEIKALRRSLGLSSEEAGLLLGGGPKAFSKYENDEIVPRDAMLTLLQTLTKHPEVLDLIRSAKGMKPAKTKVEPVIRQRSGLHGLDVSVIGTGQVGSSTQQLIETWVMEPGFGDVLSPQQLTVMDITMVPAVAPGMAASLENDVAHFQAPITKQTRFVRHRAYTPPTADLILNVGPYDQ